MKNIIPPTAKQLANRLTRLQFDEEAGTPMLGDKEEIAMLKKELKGRLIKMLGRDFYPPEKKQGKVIKPKPKAASHIVFYIVVRSPLGCKAAEFSVKASSRAEADVLAMEMIQMLGLKGCSHKIL